MSFRDDKLLHYEDAQIFYRGPLFPLLMSHPKKRFKIMEEGAARVNQMLDECILCDSNFARLKVWITVSRCVGEMIRQDISAADELFFSGHPGLTGIQTTMESVFNDWYIKVWNNDHTDLIRNITISVWIDKAFYHTINVR